MVKCNRAIRTHLVPGPSICAMLAFAVCAWKSHGSKPQGLVQKWRQQCMGGSTHLIERLNQLTSSDDTSDEAAEPPPMMGLSLVGRICLCPRQTLRHRSECLGVP